MQIRCDRKPQTGKERLSHHHHHLVIVVVDDNEEWRRTKSTSFQCDLLMTLLMKPVRCVWLLLHLVQLNTCSAFWISYRSTVINLEWKAICKCREVLSSVKIHQQMSVSNSEQLGFAYKKKIDIRSGRWTINNATDEGWCCLLVIEDLIDWKRMKRSSVLICFDPIFRRGEKMTVRQARCHRYNYPFFPLLSRRSQATMTFQSNERKRAFVPESSEL